MEKIAQFVQNLGLTLFSILKIILNSKIKNDIQSNVQAEELIVLGNGPSLKINIEKDLNFLKTHHKICVNGFALSEDYLVLKPEYYLIADFAFWVEKTNERITKLRNDVVAAINSKTDWPITFLLPFESKKTNFLQNALKDNKYVSFKYFNKTSIKGFQSFCNWGFKHNLGIPRPQNVLAPSIVVGINLGYKKVYILGADHSWHEGLFVDENNNVCLRDTHFFNAEPKIVPLKYSNGKNILLHEQFEFMAIAFKNYHIIEKYAQYRGVEVLNASEISSIDAFKRIKLSRTQA